VDSSAVISAAIVGSSTTQDFTLTVDSTPVFSSKTTDLIHTGVAMTPYLVTTKGGYPAPAITTASPLPAGVHLTDNGNGTADFNGTPGPTSGGVYPITITATNGIGSPVNQSFTLTVYQAPTVTPPANFTIISQQAMTPVTFAYAGYPSPLIKAVGLPKGLTLVNNGNGTATISGTPVFKVNGVFHVSINASSKAGTSSSPLVITVDSPPFFTSKAPPLAHTGTAIAPFTVTTLYGYPVPTITHATALPAGITLTDNGNGTATLSGTPDATAGGVYSITFDAANGVGAGGVGPGPVTQTVTWTVYQAPVLAPISNASGTQGTAITPIGVSDTGYPTPTLKASGLPPGVTLAYSGNSGTISGTPAKTGTYNVTVTAASKAGTSVQTFTFTIS
jgi:hypothetical protein